MPVPILLLLLLGYFAGTLGSAIGIGGGLIITPVLTLFLDVPIHQAIGTSLLCAIATSIGAASRYVQEGLADVRLGLTLEFGTTVGAISGAFFAGLLSREILAALFSILLVGAVVSILRKMRSSSSLEISDHQIRTGEIPQYQIKRIPAGVGLSFVSGNVSGLLGVGGGVVNIPLMYVVMRVPFKIAGATSIFMMGVTAAASAFIYYGRGDVAWWITAPVAVGIFAGTRTGTLILRRVPSRWLMSAFALVALYFAARMIFRVLEGGFQP